jgi:hypothetical protein
MVGGAHFIAGKVADSGLATLGRPARSPSPARSTASSPA